MRSHDAIADLRSVLHTRDYVGGLTHGFYRYPARFSPAFVRAAISSFSRHGDTILDPFVGGGTTVVEALAAGRRAIGVDLNSLAVFLARVKTSPLTAAEQGGVLDWLQQYAACSDQVERSSQWSDGYAKDVPRRIQALVRNGLLLADSLPPRAEGFARAVLLRVSQWALDGKEELPTTNEFAQAVGDRAREMLTQLDEFAGQLRETGIEAPSRVSRARRLMRRDAAKLGRQDLPVGWQRPRLVVTSPPYMGVHVLYNKWQVRGRRETKFAYAVSGTVDGYHASHYTFGGRHMDAESYLSRLIASFRAIRSLMAKEGLVIQLVSFAHPDAQLPFFLAAMEDAGFEEQLPPSRRRIWRAVPNRKWYVRARAGAVPNSREVLLMHRPVT